MERARVAGSSRPAQGVDPAPGCWVRVSRLVGLVHDVDDGRSVALRFSKRRTRIDHDDRVPGPMLRAISTGRFFFNAVTTIHQQMRPPHSLAQKSPARQNRWRDMATRQMTVDQRSPPRTGNIRRPRQRKGIRQCQNCRCRWYATNRAYQRQHPDSWPCKQAERQVFRRAPVKNQALLEHAEKSRSYLFAGGRGYPHVWRVTQGVLPSRLQLQSFQYLIRSVACRIQPHRLPRPMPGAGNRMIGTFAFPSTA